MQSEAGKEKYKGGGKKMDGKFRTAHQKTNISIYLAWHPAPASLY